MKKLFLFAAAFLLVGMIAPELATARGGRQTRMRVVYRGSRPHARVFINGQAFGQIQRNGSRLFDVRSGRRYTVRLTFAGRSVTKSVHIARHDRHETVTFYRP
jgi:uracil-DNA glycosylase